MNKKFYRYKAYEVRDFCIKYLLSLGFTERHAVAITDVLLEADLRGKKTHGILRLPHYSEKFVNKTIKIRPDMKYAKTGSAAHVLDADDGSGIIAGIAAMDNAVRTASEHGVGVVAVKNSSHFGIAGYYSEIAAGKNMLGIAMTHTDANTAPFGACEPYFGTNALALSVPTNKKYFLTIDFCCARISYGKIYEAELENKELPLDSGFDKHGNFTNKPGEIEFLRPAAEYKGYGLAMMIEILCTMLTGIPFCRYVNDMYREIDKPRKLGHFFMVIDISRFIDPLLFRTSISKMISDIHMLKTDSNTESVRVHGEQSYLNKQNNLKNGLVIECSLVDEFNSIGEQFMLSFPEPLS